MTPELVLDKSNAVVCPTCGGSYSHQGAVTVYDRAEDESKTQVTEIDDGRIWSQPIGSKHTNNPSRRRNGVRIVIDCESGCPSRDLVVYQHKGSTYVQWGDEHGPNS